MLKTNPQRQHARGRLWRQKYAVGDQVEILDDKEDKDNRLRQEIEDVQRLETLRKTRESRVPPEPTENTKRVKVLVKHSVEGNVSRFFRAGESMVAVYDWVGSLSLFAENFTLCLRPGRPVDPMEDVTVVDGTLLHMEISSDPIPISSPECGVNFKGFGFGESAAPFGVDASSLFSSVNDFDLNADPAAFPLPDVVMIGDERYEIEILFITYYTKVYSNLSFGIRLNQRYLEEKCHCRLFNLFTLFRSYNDTSEPTESSVPDVPTSTEGADSNTSATANPSYDAQNVNPTNSDTNNNPAVHQSRIITVHRGNVRKDLITIFQDPSIMNCHIIVEMLNERGIAEKGRGSGVFKDTLISLFWKDVYDSLMLGEGERVPSIRHDFQRKQWEAIARILLKGFQEYQYFPYSLSKTFVVSCLFGESAVSENMLMESFMQYVSEDERKVIEKCSNGELEADDENLIELLSTFDCKRTLTDSTMILKTLTELAHQELIQRPQHVTDDVGDLYSTH